MPIYDYECVQCNARREIVMSINEDLSIDCEACAGNMVRIITGSHFTFKGYGFPGNDMKRRRDRGDLEP